MNYLAHLLLADDTDESRIGNLLGDFTRGALADLAEIYPAELVRGIRMHRAVDRYTDTHAIFREGRALLDPSRSRFAGIIIDIFYDHFLCIHWAKFSDIEMMTFTHQVYQALEENPGWQAGRLAEVFPAMKSTNWLMNYGTIDGIEHTLYRMSQRSPRVGKIADGIIDLKDHYDEFEALFLRFMPDLIAFSIEWKKEHPAS